MTARPRKASREKALRLAYWNADEVLARKLELQSTSESMGPTYAS
jgi:hypothetical protein